MPRCGLDFSKNFVDSGEYKKHAENIEVYTNLAISAQMPFQDASGEGISLKDYRLKGMINPLTKADEEAANGNKRGWSGWKFWQKSGSCEQENKNADNHDSLVPVVKRKFRERIFHYFLGRDSF